MPRRVDPEPSHENALRSGCRPIRLGDAAPRLQWRHRVGFSPTSRDRRAEPVNASHRLDVNCPASICSPRAPSPRARWHPWHFAHPWPLAPSPVGCKMKCLQVLSAGIQAGSPRRCRSNDRPRPREIDRARVPPSMCRSLPRGFVNGRRFRRARRHAGGPDRRTHRADRRHRPDWRARGCDPASARASSASGRCTRRSRVFMNESQMALHADIKRLLETDRRPRRGLDAQRSGALRLRSLQRGRAPARDAARPQPVRCR